MRTNEEAKGQFYRVGRVHVFYLARMENIIRLLRCGRLYAYYHRLFCVIIRFTRVIASVVDTYLLSGSCFGHSFRACVCWCAPSKCYVIARYDRPYYFVGTIRSVPAVSLPKGTSTGASLTHVSFARSTWMKWDATSFVVEGLTWITNGQ